MTPPIRLLDLGTVPPIRSQSLFHAVGYAMGAGAVAGSSFRVTEEKKAELGLPKWVPLIADGVSYFNRRVADALLYQLGARK